MTPQPVTNAIHRPFRVLLVAAVLMSFLVSAPVARAAGPRCYVKPGGAGSVNGGSWANAYTLQLALADSGCVDIWVAAGVYSPGASSSDTFYVPAGMKLWGGFVGTETDVSQRDWTLNPTVLSGDIGGDDTTTGNVVMDSDDIVGTNSYHVLWMDGSSTPVLTSNTRLDGFTITGGSATSGSYPDSTGSGLFCYGVGSGSECSPRLENLVFSGNRATFGGAIEFETNSSGTGDAELEHVTFHGNRATYGGAIFLNAQGGTSNASLRNVTFTDNHAALGGGFYNAGDYGGDLSPSFINVTFNGNTSSSDGGALYNSAYQGQANPVIANATFNLNHADGGGGADFNAPGNTGTASPMIVNATFSGNSANLGGAVNNYNFGVGGICLPVITNSIFWGNTAATDGNSIRNFSCTPTLDHSLVQGSSGSGIGWNTNLGTDLGGNLDADPLLGPLASNGSSTQTMALLSGSAAIDSGDDTTCAAAPVSNLDQRGVARPLGQHCDIGAYEYPGHLFADVPVVSKEWMEDWVRAFYYAGITTGCGVSPLRYCPENPVTRAAMAVFVLRTIEGSSYTPPPASHYFADLPVTGKEWMEPWVDEFYRRGITGGCAASPLRYCPENAVTRAAMAVFLLRALEGSSYVPPAAAHTFADMPVVGKEWMEPFVDEFYSRGITTGCGSGPLIYCPENPVTRAAMAVFIDRAYGLYP